MDAEQIKVRTEKIVANIIINLNYIELTIKEIITGYIDSKRHVFVKEFILNNMIFSMSSKVKALTYIISKENLKINKEFDKSLKIIMNKRNMIAHSDKLLDNEIEIVGIDADWNPDGVIESPIYELTGPSITTIDNNEITYTYIEKVYDDFNKYYEIASKDLESIKEQLNIKPEPLEF